MEKEKSIRIFKGSQLDNNRSIYEVENKKASYKTLVDFFTTDIILCNNIVDVDVNLYDNVVVGSVYDDETEEYDEVYQYFIINISDYNIEYLQKNNIDNLIIAYSEVLDNYVLMVTHFGTSWDYVLTGVNVEYYE